jgi:hypothetical protein
VSLCAGTTFKAIEASDIAYTTTLWIKQWETTPRYNDEVDWKATFPTKLQPKPLIFYAGSTPSMVSALTQVHLS